MKCYHYLKMQKQIKIIQTNNGIACRIGDTIYVNKNIKEYNENLYNAILEHELSHSSSYNLKDIKIDLINPHIKNMKFQYYKFILTHPSSWTEFIPFSINEGSFVLNPTMLGLWVFALVIIGGLFFI